MLEDAAYLGIVILDKADEVNFHHIAENMEQVCALCQLVLIETSHLIHLCLLELSHVGPAHLSLITESSLSLETEDCLEHLLETLNHVNLVSNSLREHLLFPLDLLSANNPMT